MFKLKETEEYKSILELVLKAFDNREEIYLNLSNVYIKTKSGGIVLILDNAIVISCGDTFLNKTLKSAEITRIKKEITNLVHTKTVELSNLVKEAEKQRINNLKECL